MGGEFTERSNTVLSKIYFIQKLYDSDNEGGVMVIIVGNGRDDPSSNPGQGYFNFTWYLCLLESINPTIFFPAVSK